MAFGTGFITGLAGSFDKMIQLDMQRNFDKMSRAEDYALRMREARKGRLTEDEGEIKDALKEIAAIAGSNARAEAIADSVGGTKDGILKIRDTLKENQETLGDKFDIKKVYDFADVDNYATSNPVQFSDMLRKYGPKYVEDTQVSYQPTGFQKLFGKEGKTEQELVGDLVDIPERFREETDQLFGDRPDVAQPNYGMLVKAMKFEKEMDDSYGSFNEGFVDLTMKIQAAEGDEKTKLEGQLAGLITSYTKIESIKAKAKGDTKPSSIFEEKNLSNLVAAREKAYTKPYFEVDLETGIEAAIEGTQAQQMQAKMDAYKELRNQYTDFGIENDPTDDVIDPQLDSVLKDRASRVARDADAYKNTELSKFQNQDATAKFDEVATKQEAMQNIKDNKYPAGTVISYKENNLTKMIIWTGTGVL